MRVHNKNPHSHPKETRAMEEKASRVMGGPSVNSSPLEMLKQERMRAVWE